MVWASGGRSTLLLLAAGRCQLVRGAGGGGVQRRPTAQRAHWAVGLRRRLARVPAGLCLGLVRHQGAQLEHKRGV